MLRRVDGERLEQIKKDKVNYQTASHADKARAALESREQPACNLEEHENKCGKVVPDEHLQHK